MSEYSNTSNVDCVFGEMVNGRIIQKGTLVKMARGEMVRFIVENKITDVEDIKRFNRLGYVYRDELSNDNNYVFLK